MKVDMESIGERIKNRRKELHLTQTDIKSACGISSGSLSEIENGNRTPSVIIFYELSRVLGCSMDWLATGESPDTDMEVSSVSRDFELDTEKELLNNFRKLDGDGQEEVLDIIFMKLRRLKRDKKDMIKSSSSTINQNNKMA